MFKFQLKSLNCVIKRLKHSKNHWSVLQNKKITTDFVLEHFDDFYGSVFGNKWKSIRIALLCEHKYIALVNNFGDSEKIMAILESKGAINVKSIYDIEKEKSQLQQSTSTPTMITKDNAHLDRKLQAVIKNKQQTEPFSSSNLVQTDKMPLNEPVNQMKSLEKTIQDNSNIDTSRIIDTNNNTSGLYEFIPSTKIKGMEDWVLESDHYKYYNKTTDFPFSVEKEEDLDIPENLHMYTYEKGNVSNFIKPRASSTGVSTHFLMDGASILPPLCLKIAPGDRVLDACAAPGGKSLLMLQTLYPEILVCNDLRENRLNRITKLFQEYLFDFNEKWLHKRCLLTQGDARDLNEYGMYDKILCDVPCTIDRHSLMVNENNIFKPSRIKERLRMPEIQADILANCIQLLKPGGSIVYSTCSLSPVQNDGVVQMALSKVFTDFSITTTIKNLYPAIKPLRNIFKFENSQNLKYGQLVLPNLLANFGPMYICKISRNI